MKLDSKGKLDGALSALLDIKRKREKKDKDDTEVYGYPEEPKKPEKPEKPEYPEPEGPDYPEGPDDPTEIYGYPDKDDDKPDTDSPKKDADKKTKGFDKVNPKDIEDKLDPSRDIPKDILDNIKKDTEKVKEVEKERRAGLEKDKIIAKNRRLRSEVAHRSTSLARDINKTVKTQIDAIEKVKSYARMNKKYIGGSIDKDILMPGIDSKKIGTIPLIQVYLDYSGSFNGIREQVPEILESIRQFEDKGKIKLEWYAFADSLQKLDIPKHGAVPRYTGVGGGNSGGSYDVYENIRRTKPDNVLIMTDDDFIWDFENSYYDYHPERGEIHKGLTPLIIPGFVWWFAKTSRDIPILRESVCKLIKPRNANNVAFYTDPRADRASREYGDVWNKDIDEKADGVDYY